MIITQPYGGGVRWHCTECDLSTMIGGTVPSINWTNGPPPKFCSRCEQHHEYRVKLDISLLLPEDNSARVKELVLARKTQLESAIAHVLNARDSQLNECTARPLGGKK